MVLHVFPNLGTYNIALFPRVAQNSREKGVSEGLETLRALKVIPGADFFLH